MSPDLQVFRKGARRKLRAFFVSGSTGKNPRPTPDVTRSGLG
jgi:hypothetical protein